MARRRGSDPTSNSELGKYLSLGMLLPISTMVGFGMGYGLDMLFHTTWIRYVFLGLGTVAGFIELIRELEPGK
jgi:F0F1-type ATP synthase assembly protein I